MKPEEIEHQILESVKGFVGEISSVDTTVAIKRAITNLMVSKLPKILDSVDITVTTSPTDPQMVRVSFTDRIIGRLIPLDKIVEYYGAVYPGHVIDEATP